MIIYSFTEDGTEEKLETAPKLSEFDASDVFIIVDEVKRMIYIWKGLSAPVRKKFISARTASKIRQQFGLTFKVDSIDQDEEPSGFLEMMGAPVSASPTSGTPISSARPSGAPISSARPSSSSQSQPTPQPVSRPVSQPTPQPVSRPVSQPTPQPVSRPVSQPTPQPAPVKQDVVITKQESSSTVSQTKIDEIVEKIKELEVPEGLQREIVIIGQKVFSATKEFHKLFKKEVLRLDPMGDLPDGAFPASDYYTRLFLDKGEVIFVELFSEIPKTERDEFLSEVRASLRDLTKLGI